jgi:glycine/D-amino acid oxidase-like deaminating enzyme
MGDAERVDVAIIGGGITGCATAWYLARDGVRATLLEAGELNAQASGSNAGSLHAQIPHDTYLDLGEEWARDFAPTLRLLRRSIDLWEEADAAFDGVLEVRRSGGLMLASSDSEMRSIERKARFEIDAGTGVTMLGRDELRRLAPYVSGHLVGAGLCPSEGKANPLVAAPAFARAAEAAGARILRRHPVVAIEARKDLYRVHTAERIVDASRVVLAGGAGTPALARMLGVTQLNLQAVPIQIAVTEPVQALISHLLYYARAPLTMKQAAIGTVLIGGGWPARFDHLQRPVPDPRSLSQNLGLALEVVPQLAKVTVMRTWAAVVNGTDDWKPIIGELPGKPGVFLSYVPWMGFSAGPGAARIAASLVQGRDAQEALGIDCAPFAPR